MINLLEIEPNKVPVSPDNYSFMLYGKEKKGKTTFVYNLFKDRVLFIGTEKRHDAIPGIKVQHITTWSEYLTVLSQLRQPAVKELYDVICIDTTANLYDFLETYIKNKHSVQNIGDVPYGQGWSELKTEWNKGLRSLQDFGYTPVFVFHAKEQTKLIPVSDELSKGEEDTLRQSIGEGVTFTKNKAGKEFFEVERVTYDAPARVVAPVNKMVDNIMYIDEVVGEGEDLERVLRMRGSIFYDAGSTFAGIDDTIKLCPQAYQEAIKKAVQLNDDAFITDEDIQERRVDDKEVDFDKLMTEAKELGAKMFELNKQRELQDIVESTFGTGNKLTDATERQKENLIVAIEMIKEELEG